MKAPKKSQNPKELNLAQKIQDQKQAQSLGGQISIFMALVFMVIFTLFTMTVSLSMFIHDKINLQNATDLASYYVATKQAELLGAIAHNNYAIRQSFKLLAFRYRVYGNAGRTDGGVLHPGINPNWPRYRGNRSVYLPAKGPNPNSPPRVCVGVHYVFRDTDPEGQTTDNPCRTVNFKVKYVPKVAAIPSNFINKLNSDIPNINIGVKNGCEAVGYLNWWFSNTMVGAHKYEQRDRRRIIDILATNMTLPIVEGDGGMLDIEGGNIFKGAIKTFRRNLTESNREHFKTLSGKVPGLGLEIQNSMQGLRPDEWLKPIRVNLLVPYSFFRTTYGCSEAGTGTEVRNHTQPTGINSLTANSLKRVLDPHRMLSVFGSINQTQGDPFSIITLGVEKNPWYMVYNRVQAIIYSKPLFLGEYIIPEGLEMQAVSYAKPFGGRIGPWYETQWPKGSDTSSGGYKDRPPCAKKSKTLRIR